MLRSDPGIHMPQFGTGNAVSSQEVGLLQQYFSKAHSYRCKAAPYYPLSERGIAFRGFLFHRSLTGDFAPDEPGKDDSMIFDNVKRGLDAFYANGLSSIDVGDPFYQRSRSFAWGFFTGPGSATAIGATWPDPSFPYLQHTTADLQAAPEAAIGF